MCTSFENVVVLLTMIFLLPAALAMSVEFISSRDNRFKPFDFDATQVCYNIGSCWQTKATSDIRWKGIPSPSGIKFFKGEHCVGFSVRVTDHPRGRLRPGDELKKVSSFLVTQYSDYPIRGIKDLCHEENAVLNSTNSTAPHSGSGLQDENLVEFTYSDNTSASE